jgi:hypothetical protein
MKAVLIKAILTLSIASFTIISTNGQQLEWRGPDRSGVYKETNLLKLWPESGPVLLWEVTNIGPGYSSPVITSDAIYITGKKNDDDVLTALTLDGKKKWEIAYGKAWNKNYPESRCTPTYYKDKLYLVSGQGDITCITREGKKIWSDNYSLKDKAHIPTYGISESPLVVDNKVIVTPCGKFASVVAYNAENGSGVWTSEPVLEQVSEINHYVNPKLVEYGGKKIIVTLTDNYIIAVDLGNGKLIWKVDYAALNASVLPRKAHTTTPIFRDGFLFVASGYDHVAVKFKLSEDGSEPEIVWKNNDIDPHVGGVIFLDNYLYSSTYENNGKGKWVCVDWNSGKSMWINDWYSKGSIIAADNMIYIFEERSGHVGLVKPDNAKLDVVSEFQITKGEGPFWAHPVIDKGKLYIRHGDILFVYSLKSK